jgi:hypothetical protein
MIFLYIFTPLSAASPQHLKKKREINVSLFFIEPATNNDFFSFIYSFQSLSLSASLSINFIEKNMTSTKR